MSNVSKNELSGDEDMERKEENKQKKSMTYGIAINDDKSNSFPCWHLRREEGDFFDCEAQKKKERQAIKINSR